MDRKSVEPTETLECSEVESEGENSQEIDKHALQAKARRAFDLGREILDEDVGNSETEEDAVESADGAEGEASTDGDSELQEGVLEEKTATEPDDAIESLQEQVSELQEEARENYDKYLRAVAELENFKKRTLRERADLIRYAGEHIAYDLLDVVDDLERAVAQEPVGTTEEVMEGVKLILKRLHALLEKHSIIGENSVGEKFDPNKHEALATVPTVEHKEGTVVEQLKKAFLFKDKLLRPGQVVVAASIGEESSTEVDDKPEAEQ